MVRRAPEPQSNRHSAGSWGASAIPMFLCSLQLQRDQSRAEEYLQQSQAYLQDPQAALRQEAARFIGEPQPLCPSLGSGWWSQPLPCGPKSPGVGPRALVPCSGPPRPLSLLGSSAALLLGAGSDGCSVPRSCCALLKGPERGEATGHHHG